ncbi:MAG: MGMT family protein [Chitinivibrionales bacterium]|nr:MGMT family protein [Chitinivibrionales bacterium]
MLQIVHTVIRQNGFVVKLFGFEDHCNRMVLTECQLFTADNTDCLEDAHPAFKTYRSLVRQYLSGCPVDFSEIILRLDTFTPFQQAVLTACRQIPWAATRSYSQLAAASKYPKAVRAAASVMRHNRFCPIVPCHRVVHADGTFGGFNGNSSDGIALKKRLQALEKSVLHTNRE